ncbi:uncharacterized protein si:dkeyp-75h12.7 [Hoplias malabaricus]|uniref:uncharacterized protein si:dkeyp-75h12.7 n=1 Tax=Hoplias malabaricus TaxID=27720 RepID=UPI003462176E
MSTFVSALCVLCLMLKVGPCHSCALRVRTLDLGCHLQWTCPDDVLKSSTTFTVQTKTQGEEWQNVSECFQTSTYSCDVSQAFTDFVLYKHIRLGLNHKPGDTQWKTTLCDPLKDSDARFSPPTVSVSLKEKGLDVEVTFPCAPSVYCDSVEEEDNKVAVNCCPLAQFIKLNATVTLYNKHNAADTQSFSEVVHENWLRHDFGFLMEGQEYCIVAKFASSLLSEPQCVYIPFSGRLYLAVLCGVAIAFLLIGMILLWKWWASSDSRLPKSLMSLANMDQEFQGVGESEKMASEEEENLVMLSFVSLSSLTETQSTHAYSHSFGNGYYFSSIRDRQADDEELVYQFNVETDGDASQVQYPSNLYPSEAAHGKSPAGSPDPSPVLGNFCIPLSSVRVAGTHKEETELDRILKIPLDLKISNDSP